MLLQRSLRYLVLATLLATMPACGIRFTSDFEGTEVFEGLQIEGSFQPGGLLRATLEIKQPYSVPIAVSCRYENTAVSTEERRVAFNERTESVFEIVLPGVSSGSGAPRTEVLDFEFSVSEAGNYFLACFTIAAPENGIGERFEVHSQ